MSTIYEINMSNAQADVNTGRVKQNSKIVEVFSALSAGKRPEVDAAAFFQKSGRTSDFADLALSAVQIQAADIHRRMIFLLILRIQCRVQHIYGFFGIKSRLQHFFHEIQYSAAAPAGIFSRTGSVG